MAKRDRSGGGRPEGFAECDRCGRAYPVRVAGEELQPIGTDGSCRCGSETFALRFEL